MDNNSSNQKNEPNNRIIVNNLNFETDENGLREYFSKYGEVLNVEIPISHMHNKSRGFGFVTFSSIEEATKAIDPSVVHKINDRKVFTSFANKRDKEKDEEFRINKLYIGKLPKEINETELKEYFEQFGKVTDAFLSSVKFAPLLNGFPQHKGYGFVTFENEEDANKAVKQNTHVIKSTNIFVRKAIPQKDDEKPNKERRNKGGNDRKNKGGRDNRRRNKEGSSSKSETSQPTSQPSESTSSTSSNEKKAVVVKRKDDKKESSTSSTSTQESPQKSNIEKKNTNPPSTNTNTNTSSTSRNDNKKSITVNQPPKNTKPVIVIQKTSNVNPWKINSQQSQQTQQNDDFPSLSKKKPQVKKTITTTTTTVTTTISIEEDQIKGKEDVEDK